MSSLGNMSEKSTPIVVAADGSALGNPGPAGWAWYINNTSWAAGGWEHGTNNMGELKAVLDIFEATAHQPERPLHLLCDSQYAINCITKWMPGWKKKGWKKADGKPVLNQDLLKALDQAIQGRNYTFEWVKGHAGHELNEKADDLARAAATAYRDGQEPNTGPGFTPTKQTQEVAHPSTADALEDDLEDADHWEEEQHREAIATIGPERLAEHQENLLLREENYQDPNKLSSFLTLDFLWVTPTGRSADRDTVIEHRERAFLSYGEPENLQCALLNEYTALITSEVSTARGQVFRSSLWVRENYRNEIGAWLLRFRQETAL